MASATAAATARCFSVVRRGGDGVDLPAQSRGLLLG
jgi:hypothetical protein